MKANWKRFPEIIEDPNMELAEKYGRLTAHIDKIEAELREMEGHPGKFRTPLLECGEIYIPIKEILGIE